MGSMELRADTRQAQTLSPRLQRAVQLLQMSSLDFAAIVRRKLDENPFLEGDDETDTAPAGDPGAPEGPAESSAPAADEPVSLLEDHTDDRDLWMADRHASNKPLGEGDASPMDMAACDTTLAEHLQGQLNVMPLTPRDQCLAQAIVESLDDDGYLRTPIEELAPLLPLDPPAPPEELRVALKLVQSLDPAGVAARNVGECLLLQCAHIEDASLRGLAQDILAHHLDALAARDVARLRNALGVPAARIDEAIECIRHLNPRPGWSLGSSRIDYIVPDIIVRRHRGAWAVQLNPAVIPRVRLNKVYEELFQRHRCSPQHAELGDQLQDARWTIRNVEQRFSTILDVAQAIIRKQRHFLEFGAMAMKPLVLREIAEEVGVHESTVSRVTNNKYMATPLGVFELKYFFSRPMVSASGNACSATAIRELISDIIAAESPASPLSDAEITRQLTSQGLVVARRTVTKYRQLLRIEPVDKRRRHA